MFLQRNIRRSQRRQNAHSHRLATNSNGFGPHSLSSGQPQGDGSQPGPSASPSTSSLLMDGAPRPASQHHVNGNGTECLINLHQITFVANNEQYLYVQDSLGQARKMHHSVTLRLDARWHKWLRAWCSHHVSPAAAQATKDWLRCGSDVVVRGSVGGHRTPYRRYNSYRTQMEQ